MNILEMTTFLRGGAGCFVVNLSCKLKSYGHNIDVVSSGLVEELEDWKELEDKLNNFDIDNYKINVFKRDSAVVWNSAQELSALLKKNKYDLIHVNAGNPALVAYIAKKISNINIPIVGTVHSFSVDRPEWMNIADIWSYNQCNEILYVSNNYMNYSVCRKMNPDKKVIYPGLYNDVSKYFLCKDELSCKIKRKYGLEDEAVIISNLGEITERKGQLDLIKAFSQIKEKCDKSILFLIGECRNEKYLKEINTYLENSKIKNDVIFAGWVEDPYEIIAASNLFIFPTYSEGLGIAINEAISIGIPAIFSDIEGTSDIKGVLDGEDFGTFNPGDINEISKLAVSLLEMDKQYINSKIEKCRGKIDSVFNFDVTASQYEKEFIDIIGKEKEVKND